MTGVLKYPEKIVTAKSIVGWLNKIKLFKKLTDDERLALAECNNSFLKFNPKEYIVKEGQADQALYIILNGSAIVTKEIGPRETVIATLKPGEVFGELSLIRKGARLFNVKTKNPTIVMAIKPEDIETLEFSLQVKFKNILLSLVLERFDDLNQKYTQLLTTSPA